MMLPLAPPPAEVCDLGATEAAVSRLEDQAFNAMKAATEKVALAARTGPVGAAGDAEWAEYKRLRVEADRRRAEALACRVRTVAAIAPAPVATAPAEAPPPVVLAPADGGPRRFRFEASVFQADRQPSSAGRFNVETRAGYAYSATPSLPTPALPSLSDSTLVSSRDAVRPKVRSWASGFTLAGEFAPTGLGRDGWRFTTRLGQQQERTKSRIDPVTPNYVAMGPAELFNPCPPPYCSPVYRTPVTLDVVEYASGGPTTSRLLADDLKQVSKKIDLDFGAAREFGLTDAFGGLRATLGGELGAGWWTIEERERLAIFGGAVDVFRSADGPVGRAALTAALAAPAPLVDGLSWSLRSRIGYEIADLTATSRRVGTIGPSSRSTIQDMNDGVTGALGARLDYVSGPLGGFIALERRRDLSLTSAVSAHGTLGRASERFEDGSAVIVWPVYSSRLTVGVNYGF